MVDFKSCGRFVFASVVSILLALAACPGEAVELERASLQASSSGSLEAERTPLLSPQCAARDLRVVVFIEAHGEVGDIAPDVLYRAFISQLEARDTCYAGRVEAALDQYDRILGFAPVVSQRKEQGR